MKSRGSCLRSSILPNDSQSATLFQNKYFNLNSFGRKESLSSYLLKSTQSYKLEFESETSRAINSSVARLLYSVRAAFCPLESPLHVPKGFGNGTNDPIQWPTMVCTLKFRPSGEVIDSDYPNPFWTSKPQLKVVLYCSIVYRT
jgi:hypothetical protein